MKEQRDTVFTDVDVCSDKPRHLFHMKAPLEKDK